MHEHRYRPATRILPLNSLHVCMTLYAVHLQEDFLQRMVELQPDLCVTAAYGNILPQSFLDIPRFGTLNIHPSLLPQYRGAAQSSGRYRCAMYCKII